MVANNLPLLLKPFLIPSNSAGGTFTAEIFFTLTTQICPCFCSPCFIEVTKGPNMFGSKCARINLTEHSTFKNYLGGACPQMADPLDLVGFKLKYICQPHISPLSQNIL